MTVQTENLKFGVTSDFACNYLPNQKEKLLIAVDERLHNQASYTWLMQEGFRRSGNQIYRPHCQQCQACQSLRVVVNAFKASKSQQRLLKKNNHFYVVYSKELKPEYYPLYERYINTLHSDGTMYPATYEQYKGFIKCDITEQVFIEIWHNNDLVSVAVTDILEDSLSAVYTFYDPDYRKFGLGVFSILQQIRYSQQLLKPYLYLGYQINDCQKMNYKNKYHPHQILVNNQWKTVNK